MPVPSIVRGPLMGAVVLAACKQCDDAPPPPPDDAAQLRVQSGRFIDAGHVELVFSRQLAPPDGVDPQKFRLSVARSSNDRYRGKCLSSTYYCELALGIDEYSCASCYVGYDGSGHDGCPSPIEVAALVLDVAEPTRMQLELSAPIRPLLCQQLAYTDGHAFIQVHYSKLDIPTITDVSGEELDDIAPRWVLEGEDYEYHEGNFPLRDAQVPIPCPEDFG